ncbi:MAG: LuxR C-terminal-related transcriptional regulator [Vibrio sp.]
MLIDARFSEKLLLKIVNLPIVYHARSNVLFCAPEDPVFTLLSQWPNLFGYFYPHATQTTQAAQNNILPELFYIQSGMNRLPRPLLIDLFQHWQAVALQENNQAIKAKLSLTQRELEILSKLHIGHSNLDIADAFFVSENTIKSHLYRIFKKLKVKNRRQAINWARLYL